MAASKDDRHARDASEDAPGVGAAGNAGAAEAALEERVRNARRLARETAAQVAAALEAALEQALAGAKRIEPPARRARFCQRAAKRFAELKVKPAKGRLKDLRRIDALLAALFHELGRLA
ncbi:MAG: hypothetical protein NTW86_06565 [Candidatus Sumerlaeota bacterium]|nr:hypothetical protein [Candidatus Sumerlaeota bacterium]